MGSSINLPQDTINQVLYMYSVDKLPITKITEKTSVSYYYISKILNANGISTDQGRNRKHNINEHYFDVIDNGDKAYILGLYAADGCNRPKNNCISIELQDSDIQILKDINVTLGSDYPITIRDNSEVTTIAGNAVHHVKNNCVLIFNSKYLCNMFCYYGIIPRKSNVLDFATNIPKEFISHYIRGYVDGNGSIFWKPWSECHRSKMVEIASGEKFCLQLQEYLWNNYNIKSGIGHKFTESGMRTVHIYGKSNIYHFCQTIYKDANLKLQRKYDIYNTIKNEMEGEK